MGEIVNLRRVRKQKARAETRAEADANAARFGRDKAARAVDRDAAERAERHLDQHRVERDD